MALLSHSGGDGQLKATAGAAAPLSSSVLAPAPGPWAHAARDPRLLFSAEAPPDASPAHGCCPAGGQGPHFPSSGGLQRELGVVR